ncbi:uncharacterized protein At1g51745-like [Diospyros lotus]|uniref:uncharacterized protein At1g51745-like n=1 Tax=Diospyros lotus TaxID=55363 RepID=UPI0022500FA5|nr:uncharacterized protein At1g51745-like [Diospyros lotus]XP_052182483.1 uncharacterized protein At1g51745-like [Diospyros lotus]XP_052182484.1 uncharacterized protein At1g51745-like [Diospyros lotus]
MGSPSDSNTKGIDATVGGLVWVRRRNGSWWPGRILGMDELSEGCLVSPRSGTPVKLLGREDASVDWYNLEKSRRVKAFRCGEYDECIEKAKASAANSSKKAVKYARREDAILQALEIESARESKDNADLCSEMDKSGEECCIVKESTKLSHSSKETDHTDEESSSFKGASSSAQELTQSGVSFEEPNQIGAFREQLVQGRRRRTPNDSEDDGTEGVKRMRGLDDLGMSVVSPLKRKRSQVAHVHEFLKRKSRRRPLTKVLESTAMVSVPVMCEELPSPIGSPLPGVSDSKVSGLESNESKKSFSVVLNNSDSTGVSCENGISLNASGQAADASLINYKQKDNEICSISGPGNDSSDKLFDVPFVKEERNAPGYAPLFAPCPPQKLQVGAGGQSSQSSQVETISVGNEELNESGSTSSGALDIDSISQSIEKGSKWQLKGKRNSRCASKMKRMDSRKPVDVDDEYDVSLGGLEAGDEFSIGSDLKVDSEPQAVTEFHPEYRGWSGHMAFKRPQTRKPTADMKHLSGYSLTAQRLLPYRQSRFTMNPKYQSSDFPVRFYDTYPSLFEVNLEVKASYRPQHVPYISLMSKLNGKPITGHPITVEALDDGSCDHMLYGPDCYATSSSCELDDNLEDNKSVLEGVDMDYEEKPSLGAGRIPVKHLKLHRVSPNKSPKSRKTGLLSKKMRKLSSLTGSHRRTEDEKLVVEKIKGPSIACVPLKVVFSRINASLKG